MSRAYDRAYNRAKKYDKTLKAYDFEHDHIVHVATEDGAFHLFTSAFIKTWVDPDDMKWLMCFTEHEGFHVWSSHELSLCEEYGRVTKSDVLG